MALQDGIRVQPSCGDRQLETVAGLTSGASRLGAALVERWGQRQVDSMGRCPALPSVPTAACAHRRGVQALGCSRHKLGAGVGEQLLKSALLPPLHALNLVAIPEGRQRCRTAACMMTWSCQPCRQAGGADTSMAGDMKLLLHLHTSRAVRRQPPQ